MKIGIAIDPWKLAIFKKHLDRAGLVYEVTEGQPFSVIKVEGSPSKLQPIVQAANDEAARSKQN